MLTLDGLWFNSSKEKRLQRSLKQEVEIFAPVN